MNKDTVLNELVKLNSDVADIAYASEHIWHRIRLSAFCTRTISLVMRIALWCST